MKKLILSLGLAVAFALAVGGCTATTYPAYAYGPQGGGYYYDNGYYAGGYYPGGYNGGYYANPVVIGRPPVALRPRGYGGWGGRGGGWGGRGGGWGGGWGGRGGHRR